MSMTLTELRDYIMVTKYFEVQRGEGIYTFLDVTFTSRQFSFQIFSRNDVLCRVCQISLKAFVREVQTFLLQFKKKDVIDTLSSLATKYKIVAENIVYEKYHENVLYCC